MSETEASQELVDDPEPFTDARTGLAWRLSLDFVLDLPHIRGPGTALFDVFVLAAVANATVGALLCDPQLHAAYGRFDSPPADDFYRPISVNALAASLGRPFETVRRRVGALVERGWLTAAPEGVYLPIRVGNPAHFGVIVATQYEQFWRFYGEVRRSGLIDLDDVAPPPVEDPAAPAYGVAWIVADYWLRRFEDLRKQMRDPVTGLVYLGLMRANWEHLSTEAIAARIRVGAPLAGLGRPVRTAPLSRRLGVAHETVRRRAAWLVDQGYCQREGAALLSTPQQRRRSEVAALATKNMANLHRMFRQAAALVGAPAPRDVPRLARP